ncbi:MAG: ABC transporter substrate-binding protein [Sphingomonadales bacterium]|nr:ABC transporter substrate-binding protein [Sphingomonadales bacterium]
MKKWIGIAAIASLLGGCSIADGPQSPNGENEIRVAIGSDIRGTNPGISRDTFTDDVMLHMVEGLLTYRADLSPAPLLADSVSVSEDGRRYVFRLRDDVVFHNGAPLDAATVKWSWERMLDPATNWLCRRWYDGSRGLNLESIDVVDPLTVAFNLSAPDVTFLDRVANIQCMAAIIHPDSVDDEGNWVAPVGTGPYKLAEWRRGEYILLARHDDYVPLATPRDGLAGARVPNADRIRWMIIPDPASTKAALQSDQVDLAYRLQAADLAEIESIEKIDVHTGESLDWNVLLIQTENETLADVSLRRAIAHAIDVSVLAEVVSSGISTPNPSTVARALGYHTPCHDMGHAHDPALARTLLERSSYDGEPLVLQTNRRFSNMYDNAVLIQGMLAEIGINARLEVLEWTTQLNNYMDGDFQIMTFGYSGRTDPTFSYEAVLGSKQANPAMQWDSPRALDILQRTTTERDRQARAALFCEIHAMMLEDVPMLNLFNHYVIAASSDRIANYRITSLQKPRLWGVEVIPAQDVIAAQ